MRYGGLTFPSAENAFQSTRFLNPATIKKFQRMPPEAAAWRGAAWRATAPGWEEGKLATLHAVLLAKFRDRGLARALKATGRRPIVVANRRHENALGACACPACRGKGENALGRLLEQVRDEIS